jgi:hypothetical protein
MVQLSRKVRSGYGMVKNKMAAITIQKPDNMSGFLVVRLVLEHLIIKKKFPA